MRCLLFASCLLLGCSSAFKKLQPAEGKLNDVLKFQPKFTVALYNTTVDVQGNHLSGLLIIKHMPDSSMRLVFSNEMGVKFFDFAFLPDGNFKVYSIIKKMDRKPVIKTLRKDFELVLMNKLKQEDLLVQKDSALIYYRFKNEKGFYHYLLNDDRSKLVRMERASKRKPVVQAMMNNYEKGMPDSIGITHTNFNFTIGLKKIEQHVTE